jgi:hypothetical protein
MHFSWRRVRVITVMLIWLVFAAYVGGARPGKAAEDFSYNIDLTYKLDPNGNTKVISNYKVTYNRPDKILDLIKISTPTNDVKNLKVSYADGRPIKTTTAEKTSQSLGYSYPYTEITVDFDSGTGGRGAVLNFTVSYDTSELMDIKGPSKAFYVPNLAEIGNDETYTVNVSVPQGFGKMYASGVAPELNGADGSNIRYSFMKPAELQRSTTLIFGDSTVYNVDFNYPLTNDSGQTKTMTVTLPPDTSTQKVFIKSLDPAPIATRLDADGNILADYSVPARTKIIVKTDISASVKYAEYDLTKSGTIKDIPKSLKDAYTGATRYWQTTNPDLQVKAKQATAGTETVIDKVRNLQKLTIDTLTYNNAKIQYNIRQGSTKALLNPDNAVCLEYSDLLIALLRSQGIPARMPVGYAYAGNLKQSKEVSDSLHSWVEAYVPGIGWMNLDPTWGEKFDNFGKSDLDHFTFAVWGQNDSAPAAVMTGMRDENYQYENTKITYAADFPTAATTGQAKIQKYVLFPGVTLIKYEVQAPENVAGDNYTAQIKQGSRNDSYAVGSLAPRQKFSKSIVQPGASYSTNAELVFVQTSGDDAQLVLAAATAAPQWWPFFVILIVLSGIIALVLLELWLKKRHERELKQSTRTIPEIPQGSAIAVAPQTAELESPPAKARKRKPPHDTQQSARK